MLPVQPSGARASSARRFASPRGSELVHYVSQLPSAADGSSVDFESIIRPPKKPWTQPTWSRFTPANVVAELDAEAAAATTATAAPKPKEALPETDRMLLNSFARQVANHNRLGALDPAANLARASSMLRAEAWRRHETGSRWESTKKKHGAARDSAASEATSYVDAANLAPRLESMLADPSISESVLESARAAAVHSEALRGEVRARTSAQASRQPQLLRSTTPAVRRSPSKLSSNTASTATDPPVVSTAEPLIGNEGRAGKRRGAYLAVPPPRTRTEIQVDASSQHSMQLASSETDGFAMAVLHSCTSSSTAAAYSADAHGAALPPAAAKLDKSLPADALQAAGDAGRPSSAPPVRREPKYGGEFFPKLGGQRLEELVRLVLPPCQLVLEPTSTWMPPLPCLPIPTNPGPLESDPILEKIEKEGLLRQVLTLSDNLASQLPAMQVPPHLFPTPLPTPAQLQAVDLLALAPDQPPTVDNADGAMEAADAEAADHGADDGGWSGSEAEAASVRSSSPPADVLRVALGAGKLARKAKTGRKLKEGDGQDRSPSPSSPSDLGKDDGWEGSAEKDDGDGGSGGGSGRHRWKAAANAAGAARDLLSMASASSDGLGQLTEREGGYGPTDTATDALAAGSLGDGDGDDEATDAGNGGCAAGTCSVQSPLSAGDSASLVEAHHATDFDGLGGLGMGTGSSVASARIGDGFEDALSGWSKERHPHQRRRGTGGEVDNDSPAPRPRVRDHAMAGALKQGLIALNDDGKYTRTPFVMEAAWLAPGAQTPLSRPPKHQGAPRNVVSLGVASALLRPRAMPRTPWMPLPHPQTLEEVAETESRFEQPGRSVSPNDGMSAIQSIDVSRPGSAHRLASGSAMPAGRPPPPQPPQSPALTDDELDPRSEADGTPHTSPSPQRLQSCITSHAKSELSPPPLEHSSQPSPEEKPASPQLSSMPPGGTLALDRTASDGGTSCAALPEAGDGAAPLQVDSEQAVEYVGKLVHIWAALGVPELERSRLLQRHRVPGQVSLMRSAAMLEKAISLWSEVAERILQREEALLDLALFEEKASAPERLLERRTAKNLLQEASSGVHAESSTGLIDSAPAGGGRPAAWLLRESRLREKHLRRISEMETRLMVSLTRLEAIGDAAWFQGELYRNKMRTDQQAIVAHVIERGAGLRAAERAATEPFAPPGRPCVLTQRTPEEFAGTGSELRVAPALTAPMTPWSPAQSTTASRISLGLRVRPATSHAQSGYVGTDSQPKVLAYQRPSTSACGQR